MQRNKTLRLINFILFNIKYTLFLYIKFFDFKFKLVDKNCLVITQEFGGLGDQLLYSHVPRIAKESGLYSKVYISEYSNYRNNIYKKVIWESNPYVDGFVYSVKKIYRYNYKLMYSNNHLSNKILELYKIKSNTPHPPELYYSPKNFELLQKYKHKIILDLNSISFRPKNNDIDKLLNYLYLNNIKPDYQFVSNRGISLKNIPIINTNSFDEFFSIIAYSKLVLCFPTGTAMLSIALNKELIVFYNSEIDKDFLFKDFANYVNLDL